MTYHGVLPYGYKPVDPILDGDLLSVDNFRQQMRFLKSNYHVISPEEFLLWCEYDRRLPPGSILLTCDDGLKNTLTMMLPVLHELRLSVLFFITGASLNRQNTMLWYEELYLMFLEATGPISLELLALNVHGQARTDSERRGLWWELVKNLSRYETGTRRAFIDEIRIQLGLSQGWVEKYIRDSASRDRFQMLNVTELRELKQAGMCIGAHTLSHPVLSQASPQLAYHEISESRRQLEEAIGDRVWALAYPFGDPASVGRREMAMSEQAGFCCAFLNQGGGFGAKMSRFALPRIFVAADMSIAEFQAHVSGFYRLMRGKLRRIRVAQYPDATDQHLTQGNVQPRVPAISEQACQ